MRRAAKNDSGQVAWIDGQAVAPGDFVCGDGDGLVVRWSGDVEAILAKAEAITEKERRILEGIALGARTLELLGLARVRAERNGRA